MNPLYFCSLEDWATPGQFLFIFGWCEGPRGLGHRPNPSLAVAEFSWLGNPGGENLDTFRFPVVLASPIEWGCRQAEATFFPHMLRPSLPARGKTSSRPRVVDRPQILFGFV